MAINGKDFVDKLRRMLMRLRINVMHPLIAQYSDDGVTLSLDDSMLGEGSDYSGPFTIIDASVEDVVQVGIHDASESSYDYAGYATINRTVFYVASDLIEIDSSGYIYLQSIQTESDDAPSTPTFEFSTTYPEVEADTYKCVLGRVEYSDGRVSAIHQYQYGSIEGLIFGECSV